VHLLAAEGGYQVFTLGGTDKALLFMALGVALAALAVGYVLMQGVLKADDGTPEMQEIAGAIQVGAMAYITRQFRTIGMIVIPLAAVVFLTSSKILDSNGEVALGFVQSGLFRTVAFIVGGASSGAIGFLGMWIATRGNIRTTAAATNSDFPGALKVAIRTGGSVGLFTAGLGLLGATIIILIFQNTSSAILVGFGFGGSLLALFLRVGGGIFTKAADVGADLVGKVEAGIPEDDPRNPATIADNVGDNVGDCAGMASDLFESFGVTLVASIILGVSAIRAIGVGPDQAARGLIFPVAVMAIGLVASMIGIFMVKARRARRRPQAASTAASTSPRCSIVGAAPWPSATSATPTANGGELLVSNARCPHVRRRRASAWPSGSPPQPRSPPTSPPPPPSRCRTSPRPPETGPATTVLEGISSGLESAVWALIAVAVAIGGAIALGGGNVQVLGLPGRPGRHRHALHHRHHRGRGHLRPGGRQRGGHRRDVGRVRGRARADHGEPRRGGQHHQGRHQGLRHRLGRHRRRGAVRLLHRDRAGRAAEIAENFGVRLVLPINVADPKVFIGLLIGGAVPFIFSSLAIRAVGRTAGVVVQEVRAVRRRQDHDRREEARLRPGHRHLHRAASLRELATPALLAVLTPVIIGFGLDPSRSAPSWPRHRGRPAHGQLLVSNAGGAWDNAKKYIEDGHHGGKGSDATRPPSSATPSATRSRTPPARRSTRSSR
jgi:K(+)-stimulated pyrophosphate-energized sodium pump